MRGRIWICKQKTVVKGLNTSKVSIRTSLVEQLRMGVGKQTLLLYCHSSC